MAIWNEEHQMFREALRQFVSVLTTTNFPML